ncbi:hypothetical protein [Effusibacillus consociatus]|uniref:Uncharacterized protein n=1 Tax=Effusibacillus consociatus TaxID=1117041 RepID=A0ABV9Q309_9BACL
MDIHKETTEDLKNKLPSGDAIDSIDRKEFDKFQNNRNQQATVPLPHLPMEKTIKE